jgi:hypothetical protein
MRHALWRYRRVLGLFVMSQSSAAELCRITELDHKRGG